MIYPIVIFGAEVLRKPSAEVTKEYPELPKLIEDMLLTMAEADGCGLAAPQIGRNIRLFVVDCSAWGEEDERCRDYRRAFINPEIYAVSEDVRRPAAIRMRYLDADFVEHDEEFDGMRARVIQHEYDHLDGKVFTDRLSPLRRQLLKSKLLGLSKGKYRCAYKTK